MAYTSLYRKYRPDTFDKVIGQEHVVRTLKNQILSDSVGHAYVFTGTRGTGKTSVAKIFAKAINCLNPVDGSPCGVCENCKELSNPSNFDILEIDAASNNSVDQIRELTDKINFPPTVGKYKVYIVDEVHMLSKSAHNALLKTLEEPPSHAIFILATTEIHQIPATILSRCMRFDFRLVPVKTVAEHILGVYRDCGVKCERQAAELIASSGGGSVRDSMSLADMCASYCGGAVTYDGVLEVLGASNPDRVVSLVDAVLRGDAGAALTELNSLAELGKSISVLAADSAAAIRNALYIKECENSRDALGLPEEYYNKLKALSAAYESKRLLSVMKKFTALEGDFRYSSQHRILFEAALVSASGEDDKRLEERIALLERKLSSLSRRGFKSAPAVKDARQVWNEVASELISRGYEFLGFEASDAEPEMGEDFVVRFKDGVSMALFTDRQYSGLIREIFSSVCDKKLVFELQTKLDDDKALPYVKEMFGNRLTIIKQKNKK